MFELLHGVVTAVLRGVDRLKDSSWPLPSETDLMPDHAKVRPGFFRRFADQ